MKISKAVIAAAGYGTRMFPITKTIQKEMMPVIDRPFIDYVVEDLISAGVEEIIFVVKPKDTQIRGFYSEDSDVKAYLELMGKLEKYDLIKDLHSKAKFNFVNQESNEPYGTAVPLLYLKDEIDPEEHFFMFMGDDFVYNPNGKSLAQGMLETMSLSKEINAVAAFRTRPEEILHKYGIAEYVEEDGVKKLTSLIEKPEPGTAPSNLANISKYILPGSVIELVKKQHVNEIHKELLITDTIMDIANDSVVAVNIPEGDYLDSGYAQGWLDANIRVAWNNEENREMLRNLFSELNKNE